MLNFPPKKNTLTAILNVFFILTGEKYSFCIIFTPTAYATIDTTKIHYVYKPDFEGRLRSSFSFRSMACSKYALFWCLDAYIKHKSNRRKSLWFSNTALEHYLLTFPNHNVFPGLRTTIENHIFCTKHF